MPVRALLFDLDNTLYSARTGVTEALETKMNAYVQAVSGLNDTDAKALRHHYFTTYGTTLRGLQLHHDVDIEHYLDTVHQIDIASLVPPDEALCALLQQDTRPKAIFTNSPREHAERVLQAIGLHTVSMPIIDIRAMQFFPKPHQNAYRVALSTVAFQAHEVAFFEDTLHNLKPAKQLGMTTVYITHGLVPTVLPDGVDYCYPNVHSALRDWVFRE